MIRLGKQWKMLMLVEWRNNVNDQPKKFGEHSVKEWKSYSVWLDESRWWKDSCDVDYVYWRQQFLKSASVDEFRKEYECNWPVNK